MKKCMVLLLAAVMLLSLVACGKEPQANPGPGDPGDGTSNPTGGTTGENTGSQPSGGEEAFDITKWGKEDYISTFDGKAFGDYYIKWPRIEGDYCYHAKIGEQVDGTVVLVSGQGDDSPVVSALPEAFAALKEQTCKDLEALYGVASKNYNLVIDNSEPTTIGGNAMYVHKGTVSYDYNEDHRTHQYVAYATQLKSNGVYVYWMVYDVSEDQSKGDLIAQHAYRMALSFYEE